MHLISGPLGTMVGLYETAIDELSARKVESVLRVPKIAECSCERFNRYLDRALVVPTIGNEPELAYFRERP